MTESTYLEFKLLKSPFLSFSIKTKKSNRKVKDFQKLSNKEIYFTVLIVLNTSNLSISIHGQTSLKDTIALMDTYFLIMQYIEWETHQIFCVTKKKKCRESLEPFYESKLFYHL